MIFQINWIVCKREKKTKRHGNIAHILWLGRTPEVEQRSNEAWKIRVQICIFIRVFLLLPSLFFLVGRPHVYLFMNEPFRMKRSRTSFASWNVSIAELNRLICGRFPTSAACSLSLLFSFTGCRPAVRFLAMDRGSRKIYSTSCSIEVTDTVRLMMINRTDKTIWRISY